MTARRSIARRCVIWAGFVGLGIGIWFVAISPLLQWKRENDAQLAAAEIKRDRLLNSIAELQKEKTALSAETEFSDIWSAETLNNATVRVQAALSTLARDEGVTFRSIAPLQSPDMPLTDSVAFRVETELTLDRLAALLKKLEYSGPVLVVDRANLRRLARANSGTGQPTLFVQLDITAPVILTEDGS